MEKVPAIPKLELELAQELLQVYGSPIYVYDGDFLRQTIAHITQSIRYPHTKFHFASVTNGNIALLKIFKAAGWGLHANTPGDIYLGLNAGFHPHNIVYSGSNLNQEEMAQVLDWGVTTLNLDSISQLRLLSEVFLSHVKRHRRGEEEELRLGLRLNVSEDSRIGVTSADFDEAVSITQSVGLKVSGLHFYRGTGTNATSAFTDVIDQVLEIGQKLPDWQYLDFGGGFGYPYHQNGAAFDWKLFGDELSTKINNLDRKINLLIEPGRAAIAGCATMLAKVISVKWQGKKQIIGVDSTIANISVISVHGGYREIVTWKNSTSEKYLTDVCGNTTYSRDYLGKSCQLPALEIGDIIAILDVGAYGYAMSSHFLHRPKPAEVLLENSTHRLIRKREDYSVLLNNQIL
ncbi:decarboxylase [Dolichospermum sp. ST_con]|nr:decarboxylase [Dolichospermum sp. ST_con]MDD1418144.1 decarboxylase [Dolichospermum sp. ST_sed1]MDD1426945.1 decarboxylase [Dolichospermum sp. ST_sed9]MDD1431866.1 decarboxylase [Dolichospermum sp. ST_sed6]MDD1435766.1 decarboxylase [Dolichospermum sp. ST_sed10]MDD1441194.1 decarboxylase [Dolichospermum sp. ST_sed3]MDD1446706.1 decarboxylase [Dolichospermum sp. ST_sed8]MDD1455299.1 decarboxylase [Dolichospermum sp. ST_sed7]MDD1472355.1 decarboxylase [Dolichospermum sp. ST_sed4]